MRRSASWVGGVVLGIFLVVSCGTTAKHAMQGMADMLGLDGPGAGDGAGSPSDGLIGDAMASPPMTANCDKTLIATTTNTVGGHTTITTTTSYYAEIAVAGLDPMNPPNFAALICGQQGTGATSFPNATPCNGNPSCVNSGTLTATPATCMNAYETYLYSGQVLLYCGLSNSTTLDGVSQTSGTYNENWSTAYIKMF